MKIEAFELKRVCKCFKFLEYLIGCIFQLSFHSLFQDNYILFSRFPLSTIRISTLHIGPKYIQFFPIKP